MSVVIKSIKEFEAKQIEVCPRCDACDSHTIGVCLRKFRVQCPKCKKVLSEVGEEIEGIFQHGCVNCQEL